MTYCWMSYPTLRYVEISNVRHTVSNLFCPLSPVATPVYFTRNINPYECDDITTVTIKLKFKTAVPSRVDEQPPNTWATSDSVLSFRTRHLEPACLCILHIFLLFLPVTYIQRGDSLYRWDTSFYSGHKSTVLSRILEWDSPKPSLLLANGDRSIIWRQAVPLIVYLDTAALLYL